VQLRESIRLAFIRAMQVLPPRQRAALILHDVLDQSVSEVATMLETSDAAINSALQRARATIARSNTSASASDELAEKEAEAIAHLVRAWETGDFDDPITAVRRSFLPAFMIASSVMKRHAGCVPSLQRDRNEECGQACPFGQARSGAP